MRRAAAPPSPPSDVDAAADRAVGGLRLRALTAAALPAVLALETDPATSQHRPGGPPSQAEVAAQLDGWVRTWREHGTGYWLAELDGRPVGLAGLRPLTLQGRACWNLYYRFSPAVWGRGLATTAAREAVALARSRTPALPVVARTRPANDAAVRVAERAGLLRRPDLDAEGFLVLACDW